MDKNGLEKLDKIEEMIATLINMVGNMNNRLDGSIAEQSKMSDRLDKMDERFDRLDERLDKMDERLDNMQEEQRITRRDIMEKLIVIQADQDHIWEKTVKNEREIGKLKFQLQT